MSEPGKKPKETRHERFIRLMQARLIRVAEDMRLVGQLSSHNYESYPHEIEEVLAILSGSVQEVADKFGYTYQASFGSKPKQPVSPRQAA